MPDTKTKHGQTEGNDPNKDIPEIMRDISPQAHEQALRILRFHEIGDEAWTSEIRNRVFAALTDTETDNENAYPSVYGYSYAPAEKNYVEYDGQGRIVVDGRRRFRYDLVKALKLPTEEQDSIVGKAIHTLFDKLQEKIGYPGKMQFGYSGYERETADNLLHEITPTLYQLKISSPEILSDLQKRLRDIAPGLLIKKDIYILQELGNALGVQWHTESPEYAERAVSYLFNALGENQDPYNQGKLQTTLSRLQNEYHLPVSPERRTLALNMCKEYLGYPEEITREFATGFGIEESEMHSIAITEMERRIRESMKLGPEEYVRDPEYAGDARFVHKISREFNIVPEEVPVFPELGKELIDVCQSEKHEEVDVWKKNLTERNLQHYVKEAVHCAVQKAFDASDRSVLEKTIRTLRATQSIKAQCDAEIVTLFGTKDAPVRLDITRKFEQEIWKELYRNETTKPYSTRVLAEFVTKAGLDIRTTAKAWKEASNESTDIIPGSKVQWNEKVGKEQVFMRNVTSIVKLMEQEPDAPRYLAERWGIGMFSRYSTELLVEQFRREQRPDVAINPANTNKETVLVVNPRHDWNGAFERQDLYDDIADQAESMGWNIAVSEAGQTREVLRRVVRCKRTNGKIDLLILGGHSNGKSMTLSDGNELSLSEYASNKDAQEQMRPFCKKLRSYVSPDAKVIFKACSAGIQGGIAEQTTQFFDINTQGSMKPSSMGHVSLRRGEGIYKSDGYVTESQEYQKKSTLQKFSGMAMETWRKLGSRFTGKK